MPADHEMEAEPRSSFSGHREGTPHKTFNFKPSGTETRQQVFHGFAPELFGRRWTRNDLVHDAFGHIVPIPLAAKIILVFLHFRLLSVELGGKEVPSRAWPEACVQAAGCARLDAHTGTLETDTPAQKKALSDFLERPYNWIWNAQSTGTEFGAASFFNTIATAGYLAAGWVASDELDRRTPAVRFTTSPRPGYALPLASSMVGQDCRPDFFAMPLDAFVSENEREADRSDEYMEKPSARGFVEENLPKLWAQYSDIFPSTEIPDPDNVPNEGFPGHSIPLVEDYSCDQLVEERSGKNSASGNGGNSVSVEDLTESLHALQEKIKLGDLPPPPPWVKDAVKKYLGPDFLDLARVCFPNIITPGEGKETDVRAAVYQCLGYMHQQRRTQPWLHFSLGLIATKNKLGLLRADAIGIEECIFQNASSRGVVEAIRLALGIALAREQERGVHPCFSFRQKESPPVKTGTKRSAPSGEESVKQKARVTSSSSPVSTKSPIHEPKTFWHREVDTIVLPHSQLHPQKDTEGETRFYAKSLLHDRGSLVGRCTRIWCVYAEEHGNEKFKLAEKYDIPATTPIFSGPYALKFYCADILSETYKDDILNKAIKANPRHVLLPIKMWHLGKVSKLVRGLEVGALTPKLKPPDFKDRQQIATVTPLKRTLGQFATAEEFYEALIGTVKAIEALAAIGIIHRDISMGNIVLNREDYDPSEPEVVPTRISFGDVLLVRRAPVDIGPGGGLHDLDMAALIPKQEQVEEPVLTWEAALDYIDGKTTSTPWSARRALLEVPEDARPNFRTGTTPFMSIRVLLGKQHSVYDDLQSAFFVHYLSLFSYDTPGPHRYLGQLNASNPLWPNACMTWAHRRKGSMANVGHIKKGFFQERSPQQWQEIACHHCREFWTSPDKPEITGTQLDLPHWIPLIAFHTALWEIDEGHEDLNAKVTAKPCDVISALENALRIYRRHSSFDPCENH